MGSHHVELVPFLGMKSLRIELVIASYRVHCKFGRERVQVGGKMSQKRSSRDQSVQRHANHPVLLFNSSFFDCVSALASRRSSSFKRWHARLSELITL